MLAMIGASLFLLGVLLHPGRDGASIAAVGDWYGITHGVEAMGLVLVAIGLMAFYALGFVLLARWWGDATEPGHVPSPAKGFE